MASRGAGMLGHLYRNAYRNCGWWCCRSHSGQNALHRYCMKRARAREKRAWRRDWHLN